MKKNGIAIHILAAALLAVAVFAVYSPVKTYDFALFDDDVYIVENDDIRRGLMNTDSIATAFTTTRGSLWIPVVWLSFMLDKSIFSLDPGHLHRMNVLYHALASILLFLALSNLTKAPFRSAFVAAMFALHPLHVESVAWITERKDVLSALFMFASLYAYGFFVRRRDVFMYVISILLFAAGLMAKPMLVSYPLLLFLLDFWPLNRIQFSTVSEPAKKKPDVGKLLRIIYEKIPFLLLSTIISVITFFIAQQDTVIRSQESIPFLVRAGNAVISYTWYILKLFIPTGLAVFYPHRGSALPLWQVLASITLLLALTILSLRCCKSRPYLISGWLWYGISLIPVIGIVQAGMQARADRFSYIPLTGLLIMIAWGVPDILKGRRFGRQVILAATMLSIAASALLSARQIRYWKNSETLFRQAVLIPGNWLAHNNYGVYLKRNGNKIKAQEQFETSLEIKPAYAEAHLNLGNIYLIDNNFDSALKSYEKALEIAPAYAEACYNIGTVYSNRKNSEKAVEYFRKTLSLDAGFVKAHNNLAAIYARDGEIDKAIAELTDALIKKPAFHEARYNLALIYRHRGHTKEASQQLKTILHYDPVNSRARDMLKEIQN